MTIGGSIKVDFPAIMQRMRKLRADISYDNSVQKLEEDYGIHVFIGKAVFVSPSSVIVNGNTLNFKKACIASGAEIAFPCIPGVKEVQPLTSNTIFNLTELPRQLVVIGGGPIGCGTSFTCFFFFLNRKNLSI